MDGLEATVPVALSASTSLPIAVHAVLDSEGTHGARDCVTSLTAVIMPAAFLGTLALDVLALAAAVGPT
jgi:hypothetical protein